MTRTTRRHILPLTGASAVVTALALTMGPVAPGAAAPGGAGTDRLPSSVRADSTPPAPEPPSDNPGTTTAPVPSTPDTPTASSSSSSSQPEDTRTTAPSTATSSGSDDGGTAATAALKQQQDEAGTLAADLEDKKADVPEELVPSVDQLTDVLQAVSDTQTPPQERDGAVRSAQQVESALEVIADPGTPAAVRDRLTGLVQQVAAALSEANGAQTPQVSGTLGVVVARSASVLGVVARQDVPPDVENDLVGAADNLFSSVQEGTANEDEGTGAGGAGGQLAWHMLTATAVETGGDPNTADDKRKGIAQGAHENSRTRPGDPGAADKKRRLEQDLKAAIADQGLPDEPLGKAAEVCTNAVFESVPDTTLAEDLQNLTPDTWNSEGVQDFWKSRESENESLDVFAQLRNDKVDNTALAIKQMIPQLADSLPAKDIFSSLGVHALDCLQAAVRLDAEAGVQSGSWLSAAQQV
ncbi:hypothetical protein C3489_13060 [Streptomyces sp. Ru71]|uniref:hypothetical protein n=1 Tax=Streptomyces sp. Ru71 TaxID=2080746 RepID=UPI000CDE122E|nr:hypothetical protein [Streptomyces sp. Ru71]POX54806.1 hypothetical protein C3489_13060 [Streptomyces sp. Ru71]